MLFTIRAWVGLRLSCVLQVWIFRPGNYRPLSTALVDLDLAQQTEVEEHFTGAQHHRGQWIVGHGNRQPGFFADALVQIFEQRAAAGEHDAAVADVS